jgi:septal ring factor EnvC (AmiA/AmiB activator)
LTHLKKKRSCTLNCGSQDSFEDDADLRDHLANTCPKVNLICADCVQRYERWVFDSHSCLSALRNLTQEQKQ